MNHTTNYNLPQWEDTDAIKHSDFNNAMQNIDAALAGAARIVVGSYVGTGEYGSEHPTSITFDSTPKLVLFFGYLKQTNIVGENTQNYRPWRSTAWWCRPRHRCLPHPFPACHCSP